MQGAIPYYIIIILGEQQRMSNTGKEWLWMKALNPGDDLWWLGL